MIFFKKGEIFMLNSFKAFNINGFNNLIYMFTSNFWSLFMVVGVIGIIILSLKETIDTSIKDEQNII